MKIAIMIDTGMPEPTIKDDLIPNVIAQKLIVFVSMICIFLVTFAFSEKLKLKQLI